MNNSNVGHDCRNNIDNCFFAPIIDELQEVRYIRKHQNIFETALRDFVSTDLLEKEIIDDFNNKICALDKKSQFFEDRKNSFELEKTSSLMLSNQ